MKQWLLNIRQPGKRYTVWEGIRRILLCLVLGILLGMLAKQLDLVSHSGNSFWDRALEWLDLRNFLSDFPFWLAGCWACHCRFCALCLPGRGRGVFLLPGNVRGLSLV